jgi:hypothetical protein
VESSKGIPKSVVIHNYRDGVATGEVTPRLFAIFQGVQIDDPVAVSSGRRRLAGMHLTRWDDKDGLGRRNILNPPHSESSCSLVDSRDRPAVVDMWRVPVGQKTGMQDLGSPSPFWAVEAAPFPWPAVPEIHQSIPSKTGQRLIETMPACHLA